MIVAMSPDGVIKHFDIIEHITPCLLAVGIDPPAYPLPLEQLEETLSHSIVIVMAVATSALAGYQVVCLQEMLPVVTAELATLTGL
jgi:hypothetical protein